jgi:hypothetical protein
VSYHSKRRRLAQLSGDMTHGPSWYRAMGGLASQPPGRRVARRMPALGSLGTDDPNAGTTLSTPTITDPTVQWQADVLTQLRSGVDTLRTAELQKWLQIAATLSIPLAAAVWRMIFKKGVGDPTV